MDDKKRGRPKKHYIFKRTKDVHLRLSPIEYDRIRIDAERNGMSVNEYIRSRLVNFDIHQK